jgi:hypothetical protein
LYLVVEVVLKKGAGSRSEKKSQSDPDPRDPKFYRFFGSETLIYTVLPRVADMKGFSQIYQVFWCFMFLLGKNANMKKKKIFICSLNVA